MKKINWKIINFALWAEVLLSYLLPFKVIDGFQYQVGFPIPFISIYNTAFKANPFMSMHLNPLAFLVDGFILYFIILAGVKVYDKFKGKRAK